MIRSFRHKGLGKLFEDDDRSKVPQDMVRRIALLLLALADAKAPEAMNLPGARFHELKGDLAGFYSVTIPPTGV